MGGDLVGRFVSCGTRIFLFRALCLLPRWLRLWKVNRWSVRVFDITFITFVTFIFDDQIGEQRPLLRLFLLIGLPVGFLLLEQRQSVFVREDAAEHVRCKGSFFLQKFLADDRAQFDVARLPQGIQGPRSVFGCGQCKINALQVCNSNCQSDTPMRAEMGGSTDLQFLGQLLAALLTDILTGNKRVHYVTAAGIAQQIL